MESSLIVLLEAVAIAGAVLFLWELLMAPVRVNRSLEEKLVEQRREATAALTHSAQIGHDYGSNIARGVSLPAVRRQLGTELRDIRHKIELVKTTRVYRRGFQLPAARWDQYDEVLAERPELYGVVDKAYTAAHHVNEAVALRATRIVGKDVQLGVHPDDGLDAAYDAAGEALDALGESRGEAFESAADRAARLVTEDVLQELQEEDEAEA